MKKIKVTVKICGSEFSTEAETISEAYELVKSILRNVGQDNPLRLSTCMEKLVEIVNSSTFAFENNLYRICLLEDKEETI